MANDEILTQRVRTVLADLPGFSERRMFGGVCFLLHGHMTAGVEGAALVLRVGADQYWNLLAEPHAREMTFTGRPLKGMLYVDPAGLGTDRELAKWLKRAVAFVGTLAPKPEAPARAKRRGKRKAG